MSPQIAVRLTVEQMERLDESVAAGRYPTRAEAVRAGIELLLGEERERGIVEAYRRGYERYPVEPELVRDGDLVAEEAFSQLAEEERALGLPPPIAEEPPQ